MHIAIYTDDPDKGGVASYNDRIARGLVAAGFRVSIVQTPSEHPMIAGREELGIRHEWITYDTGVEFARTITDTADAERAFSRLQPDMILFSDCCPVSNLAAKHVAISRDIPFVIAVGFVASYLSQRFAACLPVLAKQFLQARAVIAVSSENLELLRKEFNLPSDKGEVVFYGVPENFFAARDEATRKRLRIEYDIPANAVVSFTAARLSAVKGHVVQLHAVAQLVQRKLADNLVCVWAGTGETGDQLAAEVKRLGLTKHIRLVGHQNDVAPWLDAADIFTLTSLSEGMPIAIMEAMAKGLPVVATAISGIPEELGSTGQLLADPAKKAKEAVQQLAQTFSSWSTDHALRQRLGTASHQRARQHFRVEQMIANTITVINRHAPAVAAA
jgi:glycosyltransferase involved in cell wall biosynthesis